MFGKLLSLPIRIVNIPFRFMEKLVCDPPKHERIMSKPLSDLAEVVEEVLDGEK